MSHDIYDSPEFRRFAKHVRTELADMIGKSKVVVSIVPEGTIDAKFAVELGASVMLDKPIIALVQPGTKIPEKLARVVDRFVEVRDPASEESREHLMEALQEVLAEMDDPSDKPD